MNEDVITVVGRLGGDPMLKSVHGDRVAEFRLSSKPRRKEGETWVDGPPNWYSVEAWGDFAQHVATSLRKGDLVVVLGKLKVEQWESGERRGTSVKIRADHIGHTLRAGAVAKDRRPREQDPARAPEHQPVAAAEPDREPEREPAMALTAQEAWTAPLTEPDTPF
ncbi:single-stranded DNA-binding protein [Agrococcus sp. UYP10]|uniref:single-stranded DNA-binding protein n=1 Tax=Agrococcus sp. UYP10 TaxID=1756355 RepID=UPI003391D2E5